MLKKIAAGTALAAALMLGAAAPTILSAAATDGPGITAVGNWPDPMQAPQAVGNWPDPMMMALGVGNWPDPM